MAAAPGAQPIGDKLGTKIETKDLGTETLTISGRKIVCKVKQVTFTRDEKKTSVSKSWTSDQVPGGEVKFQTGASSKYVRELVEFKRGK